MKSWKSNEFNWKTLSVLPNMEIIILQIVSFSLAIFCIVCNELPTIWLHWRFYLNNNFEFFWSIPLCILFTIWIGSCLWCCECLKVAWTFLNLCKSIKILVCIDESLGCCMCINMYSFMHIYSSELWDWFMLGKSCLLTEL